MFLDRILAAKRVEVAERVSSVPLAQVQRLASRQVPVLDFGGALRAPGLSVIAEVKRASPSRGMISASLDPVALAQSYVKGGCAAISVLTDRQFFGALSDDLQRVRASVSVPLLRKDFVIEEYQLWESRVMGADAVLLIAAVLGSVSLHRLVNAAHDVGIHVLVEVHNEEELRFAIDSGVRQIGINNRDLRSFRVDLNTTETLARLVPPDLVVVSESGISGSGEAELAAMWGADAILVGEALVTSPDPALLIADLRSAGGATKTCVLRHPRAGVAEGGR